MELIRKAKEEMERIEGEGGDVSDIKETISKAESDFDQGDYGAADEKIERIFEAVLDEKKGS